MEPEATGSTLGQWGAQSALRPAGQGAALTFDLTVAMVAGFGALFVIVLAIVWFAWVVRRPAGRWWVWAGGIVLPLATILVLMVASTAVLVASTRPAPEALVVEVTGHQFWWDIVYDPEGAAIRDANELVLPAGQPVTLRLKSNDVIHSFWVPSVAGKMDMIPGRVNTLTVRAGEPGRYRGQCAEFCGLSHPRMAFEVVVMEPAAFALWLADLAGEARDAARPELLAGRDVFVDYGCPACHEVRGVAEGGRLGPDLTRVGGRATLGAGMWRMNQGNLAGWVADVGDMKPGAQMPSYNHLTGPELRAVSAWLASLE